MIKTNDLGLGLKYPLYWSNWAIEPTLGLIILDKIVSNKPKVIVELGAGVSTILIKKLLSKLNYKADLYSIESDKRTIDELTNRLTEEELLDESIHLLHAELKDKEFNGNTYTWYDIDREITNIDLLIVDGPPGNLCKNSRYPALPHFHNNLSKDAILIIDDTKRPDETEILELWRHEYKSLIHREYAGKTKRGSMMIYFK